MSPRPFITDTDNGEIHAFLDGKFIRGWSYKDETEWRWKMKMAREFCEGWHQALDAIALSPGVLIANGTDGTPDGDAIDQANAHLIAAAPDMYEALRSLIGAAETLGHPEYGALLQAREAISKAEGRAYD